MNRTLFTVPIMFLMNNLVMESPSVFHEGERYIQYLTGTREAQEEVGRYMIRDYIPDQHRDFFTSKGARPHLFVSTLDARGRPWASMMIGMKRQHLKY